MACVCVSVSRKGQFRTKSVTHNLQGPETVPFLFATCLVENNTYTLPHTHSVSLSCGSLCGQTKLTTAEIDVAERNIKWLSIVTRYTIFKFIVSTPIVLQVPNS